MCDIVRDYGDNRQGSMINNVLLLLLVLYEPQHIHEVRTKSEYMYELGTLSCRNNVLFLNNTLSSKDNPGIRSVCSMPSAVLSNTSFKVMRRLVCQYTETRNTPIQNRHNDFQNVWYPLYY